MPKFWASCVVVVAASALLAAVTAVAPAPYAEVTILPPGPSTPYGRAPDLQIAGAGVARTATLLYATRWNAAVYKASGPIEEFLGRDGLVDAALLMSLAKPSEDKLAASYLEMSDANSVVVVRDPIRERDVVRPFHQSLPSASGEFEMKVTSWRGHSVAEYTPLQRPARSTIIFLGGTDGQISNPALSEWASLGMTVISLPWVDAGTQTPGCLDRIDLDLLAQKVNHLVDLHAAAGPVSLVGFSGGADAALMIANKGGLALHSVHAISPTAWHFNGARGPACALPSSPWLIDGEAAPYAMNFAINWRTPFNLARRALGGLSQNTLAEEALEAATPDALKTITYDVSNISYPAFLYAGALDDLTPSAKTLRLFCREIKGADCYTNASAGHDIFGAPSRPVFCDSPREALKGADRRTYCLETARARQHVFHKVSLIALGDRPSGH